MTQDKFVALCEQYLINPEIALENDDICEALRQHDDLKVERLLQEEF